MPGLIPPIVLVGCVKTKLDRPAEARDLYTSPLFRFRRAYAERTDRPWWVISAKHYLVNPWRVIEPYDLALGSLSAAERRSWGIKVAFMLAADPRIVTGLEGKTVEIHAGLPYREALDGPLRRYGATPVDPVSAGSLGATLAWYSHQEARAAGAAR